MPSPAASPLTPSPRPFGSAAGLCSGTVWHGRGALATTGFPKMQPLERLPRVCAPSWGGDARTSGSRSLSARGRPAPGCALAPQRAPSASADLLPGPPRATPGLLCPSARSAGEGLSPGPSKHLLPPEWDPPSCIPAGNERSSPPATQRGAGRARSHAEGAFGCHARAALVTARQSQGSSHACHAAAGPVRWLKLSEWRAPRKRNATAEGTEREVSAGAPDAGLPRHSAQHPGRERHGHSAPVDRARAPWGACRPQERGFGAPRWRVCAAV